CSVPPALCVSRSILSRHLGPSLARSLSSSPSLFFNATAPTEIYTLSLHDALPISAAVRQGAVADDGRMDAGGFRRHPSGHRRRRSEEHTSELQSRENLVCRLLLEKKKRQRKSLQYGRLCPLNRSLEHPRRRGPRFS